MSEEKPMINHENDSDNNNFGLQAKKDNVEAESEESLETFVSRLIKDKVGLLDEPDAQEHIVDLNNPEIQKAVELSKEIFNKFVSQYALDKEHPETGHPLSLSLSKAERNGLINSIIENAKQEGIFEKAEKMRELIYDHNESYYGVCYISDECTGGCAYCPHNEPSQKKQVLLRDKKQALVQAREDNSRESIEKIESIDQAIDNLRLKNYVIQMQYEDRDTIVEQPMGISPLLKQDLEAIVNEGHDELCILAGDYGFNDISLIINAAKMAATIPGVNRLVLNMGVYTDEEYRRISDEVKAAAKEINPEFKLQFRIFQETYNEARYKELHYTDEPKRDTKGEIERDPETGKPITERVPSKKGSYEDRLNSQERALANGFDEAGTGVLIGLSDNPIEEIKSLVEHIRNVNEKFKDSGKQILRSCIPIANKPDGVKVVIDHYIYEIEKHKELIDLLYSLHRLGTPDVSVVHSERDQEDLRSKLTKKTNHTTLFVHPEPGGNTRSLLEESITELNGEDPNTRVAEIYSKLLISQNTSVEASNSLKRILGDQVETLQPIVNLIENIRRDLKQARINPKVKEDLEYVLSPESALLDQQAKTDQRGFELCNRLLNIVDMISEPQKPDVYRELADEIPSIVQEALSNETIPATFREELLNLNLIERSSEIAESAEQINDLIEESLSKAPETDYFSQVKETVTQPPIEEIAKKVAKSFSVLIVEKETSKSVMSFLQKWHFGIDPETQSSIEKMAELIGGKMLFSDMNTNAVDVGISGIKYTEVEDVEEAILNGNQNISKVISILEPQILSNFQTNRTEFAQSLQSLWHEIEGTEAIGQAKVHPDKPSEKMATNIILGINNLNFRKK